MPAERLLFVFRHGETDWNREGRLQGRVDVPLNPTGLAQAEALARRLARCRLDAILSSDMLRAWTTARIVAEVIGVPLYGDAGLRETDVGEAEGLLWEEAKARFEPGLTERWYSEDGVAFPGGETGSQTRRRGLDALRRFALAQPHRRIGVSTHGAMLRQLMKHAGAPARGIGNTVLYILAYDPATGRLTVTDVEELPEPFEAC